MNQNDPFASVRAPKVQRQKTSPDDSDPFASVRSQKKEVDQEEQDLKDLQETSLMKYGKAGLRGLGKAASNLIQTNARHQEEASLPALLGIKQDVSQRRNLAQSIEENIPEESEEAIPAAFSKGVEYAAHPLSALGGPAASFIAGASGKLAEKAGAPKWLQIAVELGSTLLKPGSKKVYTDKSPEIMKAQEIMRKKGFPEEEVTLATNALKERSLLEKASKMTKSAEKTVESTKNNLEKGVADIISDSFPGYSQGIEEVEKRASQLFEPVNKEAKNLVVMNPEKFTGKVDKIIDDVRNTLANTPDENAFIQMLETAKKNAVEGRSGDTFVNFYQTLNRIGKWVDPSKKESYMREAKDAIKDTLRDNGKSGQKLASDFEKANLGWVKLNQAQKVNKLLQGSYVDEAMDFNKLSKTLGNEKNYSTVKDALGDKAAANLKLMSHIGKNVERTAKAMEGSTGKQALLFGKVAGNVMAFMSLNPATIASTVGGIASIETGRYLATQLLINPKYQNLWIRMADKFKSGNITQAEVFYKQLVEMAKEESED